MILPLTKTCSSGGRETIDQLINTKKKKNQAPLFRDDQNAGPTLYFGCLYLRRPYGVGVVLLADDRKFSI